VSVTPISEMISVRFSCAADSNPKTTNNSPINFMLISFYRCKNGLKKMEGFTKMEIKVRVNKKCLVMDLF
jgi:hypothetical protein